MSRVYWMAIAGCIMGFGNILCGLLDSNNIALIFSSILIGFAYGGANCMFS